MIGDESIALGVLAAQRACDELSRRLRAGHSCCAEEFFKAEPTICCDTDAVLELLYTEFLVREQLGQQPQPQAWYARFPQWHEELKQLFEVHEFMDAVEPPRAGLSGTHGAAASTLGLHHRQAGACAADCVAGGYDILDEIGRGGMGIVYQARQRGLGRMVALKMILPPHGPRERARFRTEAEATARLSHPNIVQIYEVGQEGDRPFLSMEYVPGKSLDKHLAASLLAPRTAAELLLTLSRAVAYAHEQGIVHRDLKPANVVLAADGTPKITDFGLARRLLSPDTSEEPTADAPPSGAIVGTPSYMAPEQCQPNGPIGPTADVYALGAILYEALTGRPPFRGQTTLDVLDLVRSQEPVPPSRLAPKIPRDLETICLKCLAKQPQQRYASAAALAEDLRRFLGSEPILARPVGRSERAIRWSKRNPVIAALAAGITLALLCGTAVSTALAVWALHEKGLAAEHARRADDSATQARTSAQQEQVARELAEYRFTQAEKAVEEYLDGIESNEQLKEADFLELRKRLVASAVPFYEEFVQQRPGDKTLEAKRGRAYGRLGFIRKQMGEREQAAADFEQMRAIFERLGTTDPSVRRELARSHYGLASALHGIGPHPEVEIEYRQSLDLYRKLAAEFPHDAGYRKQLALCQRDLGLLFNQVGKRAEAVAELRGALAIAAGLAAANPAIADYRGDLAGIHSMLANILGAQDEAEAYHREAVDSFQQLAAEFPDQPGYRLGLGTAHTNLAVFLSSVRKQSEEALAESRTALALRKQLAAEFPAIPAYRQHLALAHRNLGSTLASLGKREDAEGEVRKSLALLEHLTADFRGLPAYRFDLSSTEDQLGGLLDDLGRAEEAEKEHRKALAIRAQLVEEFPAVPEYRRYLARSHYQLGVGLGQRERYSEAHSEFAQAIELRERLHSEFPDDFSLLHGIAVAQNDLALALYRMKRRPESIAAYRESSKSWLLLVERFPANAPYRSGAAKTLRRLADFMKKDGETEKAWQLYAQAALHQHKAHQAVPSNSSYADLLRSDYHGLGDFSLLRKDHAAAAEAADKLGQVRPEVAADAELAARFFGRCVTLAEQDTALAEIDRQALAKSYADRAMDHLREAVRRGYDKVGTLKSLAALKPLKDRPDFQQLVEELESR